MMRKEKRPFEAPAFDIDIPEGEPDATYLYGILNIARTRGVSLQEAVTIVLNDYAGTGSEEHIEPTKRALARLLELQRKQVSPPESGTVDKQRN